MSHEPDIAVVIATRNRSEFLVQVIDALVKQSEPPLIVVIADASDQEEFQANQRIISRCGLDIKHLFSPVRSLTHQKNMAVRVVLSQLSTRFIQVLDDDTIPDSAHLATLRNTLYSNPDAVGASGITIPRWTRPNKPAPIRAAFRICGLDSRIHGQVTGAGIGIPVDTSLPEVQESQWLFGCSMWRREVFLLLHYAPDFLGSGLFEDLEFSTRARHFGRLLVDPSATLLHRMAESGRPDSFLYSYRFIRNRRRVIHNLRTKRSLLLFPLSIVLQTIVYATKRGQRWQLLRGTARGILDEVKRRPLL